MEMSFSQIIRYQASIQNIHNKLQVMRKYVFCYIICKIKSLLLVLIISYSLYFIFFVFFNYLLYGEEKGKIKVSVQIHTQQITGHKSSIQEIHKIKCRKKKTAIEIIRIDSHSFLTNQAYKMVDCRITIVDFQFVF